MTGRGEGKQRRPYVAVVHRVGHSGYGVSFPDVPGCTAAGRTVDQAMRAAREALDRHLGGLKDAGKPLPAARDFHAVIMSTDSKGAIAFILI
jgi:predicted RNase H-like HicB family nuclease